MARTAAATKLSTHRRRLFTYEIVRNSKGEDNSIACKGGLSINHSALTYAATLKQLYQLVPCMITHLMTKSTNFFRFFSD